MSGCGWLATASTHCNALYPHIRLLVQSQQAPLSQGHARRQRWRPGVGPYVINLDLPDPLRRFPWRTDAAAIVRPNGRAHRLDRVVAWQQPTGGRWEGRWGTRSSAEPVKSQSTVCCFSADAAAHGLTNCDIGDDSSGGRLQGEVRTIISEPASGVVDTSTVTDTDHSSTSNISSKVATPEGAKRRRRLQSQTNGKYRGMQFVPHTGRWKAILKVNGMPRSLGAYASQEEAAVVYDMAVLHLYGPTAKLNFPRAYQAKEAVTLEERSWGEMVKTFRLQARKARGQKGRIARYKGLSSARDSKWRVEIAGPGRKFHPTKWYLGLYESEEQAAIVYDKAARYRHGSAATLNFPEVHHAKESRKLAALSWDEVVAALRLEARLGDSTMPNPISRYRGVDKTLTNAAGKWDAFIYVKSELFYLGQYATEKEAAAAYDKAARYKYGSAAELNLPEVYGPEEAKELAGLSWDEVLAALRREARIAMSGTTQPADS
mmetsp:Transcript_13904/g.41961  ORF Transcript_13904/g.41961 Transcript_13904/m.41961 type:complete len:489 (+) Transcript_13904:271-1737(+)